MTYYGKHSCSMATPQPVIDLGLHVPELQESSEKPLSSV